MWKRKIQKSGYHKSTYWSIASQFSGRLQPYLNAEKQIVKMFWPHGGLYELEEVACKYATVVTGSVTAQGWSSYAI